MDHRIAYPVPGEAKVFGGDFTEEIIERARMQEGEVWYPNPHCEDCMTNKGHWCMVRLEAGNQAKLSEGEIQDKLAKWEKLQANKCLTHDNEPEGRPWWPTCPDCGSQDFSL